MSTETNGGGDVRRSLELLWGTPEQPTRGPKPGLSSERIVHAAIEVADGEGLGALSMRRIATVLGVGAMSLYRYVPGKGELVDLMVDQVYGEDLAEADADTGDWRQRMEASARREWALYLQHPWLLQVPQGRPMLGPNAMRSTDIALRAVDGIGLDEYEMISAVMLVSSYVAGLARTTIDAMQAAERTGISDEDWWAVQAEYVGPAVLRGELPLMQKVGEAGAWSTEYDTFSFGLQRVLDGLEVLIEARSGEANGPLVP